MNRATLVTPTAIRWGEFVETAPTMRWWEIRTEATGEHWFRIVGVAMERAASTPAEEYAGPFSRGIVLGRPIPLQRLHVVPQNTNLIATEAGPVNWNIGTQNDGLTRWAGPLWYAYPYTRGSGAPVEGDPQRFRTAREAVYSLLASGLPAAQAHLERSRLFERAFPWNAGPPAGSPLLNEGAP